jgi:imidazolonepropionase-like amidohydrolase
VCGQHTAGGGLPRGISATTPSAQILCVNYGQDLADKLARDCRSIMVSADLSDPPGAASPGGAGVHHHPPGLPARGADAIKFVATGGVLSNIKAGLDQQFTDDEICSIIETAHRLGRRVAAHAHGAAGINAALEAGVDSIEHGSFLDARSLELFVAKGAFHVPTIIAGVTVLEMAQADGLLTPAQIEKAMIVGVKIKEALARSHKAGVTIAFGTDMGVGPHGQNAGEFSFMVEAGMRFREAIKAATVNAAKLLDLSDEVGTIASGKSADVIAVDSSPLDDVSVLQRVAFVMARGDVYLGVTA